MVSNINIVCIVYSFSLYLKYLQYLGGSAQAGFVESIANEINNLVIVFESKCDLCRVSFTVFIPVVFEEVD